MLDCGLRRAVLTLAWIGLLAASPAAGFDVFQDPGNNGTNSGLPAAVPLVGNHTLHVWLEHGDTLSQASLACSGQGSGNELCGWKLRIEALGGTQLVSFTADPNLSPLGQQFTPPSLLKLARVGPVGGQIGAQRVGTLVVSASALGTVEVTGDEFVDGTLVLSPVAQQVLAVGDTCTILGGDLDGDGICANGDGSGAIGDNPCSCREGSDPTCRQSCDDNCPNVPNADQLDRGRLGLNPTDPNDATTPNGTGDRCECGDINGDGRVSQLDATQLKRAALGLSPFFDTEKMPEPGNCDVNGSEGGLCNNNDATITKRAILALDPGIGATCRNAVALGIVP